MSTPAAIRRALTEAPVIAHRLWVVLLLNLGGTVVQLLIPIIVQQTLDRHITGDSVDLRAVAIISGLGLMAVVVGGVMTRAGLVRLIKQSTGLSDLRVSVFSHLMQRSMLTVQTERRGALVSRVTSDVTTLQEFLEWGGVMFLSTGGHVTGSHGRLRMATGCPGVGRRHRIRRQPALVSGDPAPPLRPGAGERGQ
jgi:ABC-type multidrug transport system fused ATPase/permease subunit